jgi:hypothetical protein
MTPQVRFLHRFAARTLSAWIRFNRIPIRSLIRMQNFKELTGGQHYSRVWPKLNPTHDLDFALLTFSV